MYETNDSIEGTEGLKINSSELNGVGWVSVKVLAENVGIGNYSDMLGNDGDMLGFALGIRGVNGVMLEHEDELPEEIVETPIDDNETINESDVSSKPVYEKEEWDRDKSEMPNKTNENSKGWLGSNGYLFWIGGSCLVLTIISVVGVAVISNNIDKKRKRKEIDEQMALSKNKLDK
jgi:hypothetical protein